MISLLFISLTAQAYTFGELIMACRPVVKAQIKTVKLNSEIEKKLFEQMVAINCIDTAKEIADRDTNKAGEVEK
jgi:hypothetical protein